MNNPFYYLHVSVQIANIYNEVVACVTLTIFSSLETKEMTRLNNMKHVFNT